MRQVQLADEAVVNLDLLRPLFAAALQNGEFRELFKTALKEIGSRNFSMERVESTLKSWAAEWQPFMADYYKRFSDTSAAWDPNLQRIEEFYARRYDSILPTAEQILSQIQ